MLRMDDLRFVTARSYAEAYDAWTPDAMYVAGGTDLLPNLKHRIVRPKVVIDLSRIAGTVTLEENRLRLGAGLRLDMLAADPTVQAIVPPLATAASLVAGPQLRAMGTLGGNVMLDTRCLYYNQTEFWRNALGYCLKADGTWCHVVGGPKTCVATQSSDTVPVLLALDARLRVLGRAGERSVPLRELYRYNGMDHLTLARGELVTEIVVPRPAEGFRGSYTKLRTRDAIDFPQLGLAVVGTWSGDVAQTLEIVVGAVSPQPKPIRGLGPYLGRPMDDEAVAAIADAVWSQTRPQGSVHGDTTWRRQMAAVFTRRALRALRAG